MAYFWAHVKANPKSYPQSNKRDIKNKNNKNLTTLFFFYFYFSLSLQLLPAPPGGTCVTTDENKLTSCPSCVRERETASLALTTFVSLRHQSLPGKRQSKEIFVAAERKKSEFNCAAAAAAAAETKSFAIADAHKLNAM